MHTAGSQPTLQQPETLNYLLALRGELTLGDLLTGCHNGNPPRAMLEATWVALKLLGSLGLRLAFCCNGDGETLLGTDVAVRFSPACAAGLGNGNLTSGILFGWRFSS